MWSVNNITNIGPNVFTLGFIISKGWFWVKVKEDHCYRANSVQKIKSNWWEGKKKLWFKQVENASAAVSTQHFFCRIMKQPNKKKKKRLCFFWHQTCLQSRHTPKKRSQPGRRWSFIHHRFVCCPIFTAGCYTDTVKRLRLEQQSYITSFVFWY